MISILSRFSAALLYFQLVASTSFYPLKIGQDFQAGYSDNDILRGFKLNVAEGENPLKDKVFDGDIIIIPFSSTYDRSNLIQGYKDAEDSMAISGSLGVTYKMTISGRASATYLQNTKSSKNEATITYRLRRVAYAKKVDTSSLTPTEELNGNALSADTIAEKYGTKFIDQMLYGAQLDIDFKFSSDDERYIQAIGAKLKGEINLRAVKVDFDAEFGLKTNETESSLQVEITASTSGLPDFSIPANPSFDDVLEAIDDFGEKYIKLVEEAKELEQVDSIENVLKKFSPVGFSLSSISDYQPTLSNSETAALEDKMSDLADIFFSTLYLKEQLKAARDRQKTIYTDPRDKSQQFNPYSEKVDRVIELLDSKVDECLDYQRLPMAEIIGREGDATVPAANVIDRKIKDGLLGNTFLPSSATILNTEFMNEHYVGYGLEVDGAMEPWLSGSLRKTSNDGSYYTIANATTPAKLVNSARKKIGLDESKIRINTKDQTDEEKEFILNEWTGDGTANLENFKITDSGSLSLEYMSYVEDLGRQDWKSSGFVGNPTNTSKFMEAFAIRIVGKTQHSVSYAAQISTQEGIVTTQKFRDGEICGCIHHGKNKCLKAPIKAFFVSIETKKKYAPCKGSLPCRCEDSICHDATKTTSHAPSMVPSIYPTSSPTISKACREQVYLEATQDSYIRSGQFSNDNYGSAEMIMVKKQGENYNRKSIVEFDMLPDYFIPSQTKFALQLELLATDGTFDISVFRLYNTDWSENDVTWNNFNASILQEGGNFQGGVDDKGKIFEVDVTDLVKHDASNLKVTLLLEAKRSNVNIWISSSESKSGTPPTLLLSCD